VDTVAAKETNEAVISANSQPVRCHAGDADRCGALAARSVAPNKPTTDTTMNCLRFHSPLRPRRAYGLVGRVMVVAAAFAATAQAGPPGYKVLRHEAGGVLPHPTITSITKGDNVTINWIGIGGPFQVEQATSLPGEWQPLGDPVTGNSLTVPGAGATGFLRVKAPTPLYAGAVRTETLQTRCDLCHDDVAHTWLETAHARALETLKRINQHNNARCLQCHTVGSMVETGFKSEAATPHLAGVQCENCHGPGGPHVARVTRVANQPIVSLSANVCGGCHTDAHHPTFDEWESSLHAHVTESVASGLLSSNPATSLGRMNSCGACHSGAVRNAFLQAVEYNEEVKYPTGEEAAETGITCAVCHDPHKVTGHPAQLRFPAASTEDYSYSTSTAFAQQYKPNVSICGQCHNARGAVWTQTSRYPHYSPQYNMLNGIIGVTGDVAKPPQSFHMDLEKQCAQCHTHGHEAENLSEATPNYTGHEFKARMDSCMPCHDDVGAFVITEAVQENTKKQIKEVKALLDQWALTKSHETLRRYGVLAWEYTTRGHVSDGAPEGLTPPTTAHQALIPDEIKQARFNVYMVYQDGSYGVHNGNYSRFLLKVARDKVNALLK